MIAAVDQQPGQRGIVELDHPFAAAPQYEHVGGDRIGRLAAAEPAAGLGIVAAQLANHVGKILVVHLADALQRGEIALRQIIEMVDQARHRRIVPVGILRLQGQALG